MEGIYKLISGLTEEERHPKQGPSKANHIAFLLTCELAWQGYPVDGQVRINEDDSFEFGDYIISLMYSKYPHIHHFIKGIVDLTANQVYKLLTPRCPRGVFFSKTDLKRHRKVSLDILVMAKSYDPDEYTLNKNIQDCDIVSFNQHSDETPEETWQRLYINFAFLETFGIRADDNFRAS